MYLGDIINNTFAKFIPSNIISIIFPIKYIAIAEYKPTSIVLKTITLRVIIIVSVIKIRVLDLYCGLNDLITYDNKSDPPVEALYLKIIAVPIPDNIPPYMHPRNLSCVNGINLSKISTNTDNATVPYIDLIKSFFPTLKYANINSGIFNINIVVPTGSLNK